MALGVSMNTFRTREGCTVTEEVDETESRADITLETTVRTLRLDLSREMTLNRADAQERTK